MSNLEIPMRVHPSTMNIATVNAYAAAAENALAAQRAADVRKKLARSAASPESATTTARHGTPHPRPRAPPHRRPNDPQQTRDSAFLRGPGG